MRLEQQLFNEGLHWVWQRRPHTGGFVCCRARGGLCGLGLGCGMVGDLRADQATGVAADSRKQGGWPPIFQAPAYVLGAGGQAGVEGRVCGGRSPEEIRGASLRSY